MCGNAQKINPRGGLTVQEREIIEMLGSRNERGVDELMKHYGPLIKYIIAPILESPQDREECLGETVMKIWDKIGQFNEQRGSFKALVTSIARNTALNHRRKNEVHGGEELLESVPAGEVTPEEQVLQSERRKELMQALYRLSAKDRALFYRKYYYCQSIEQIASEVGMTKRAVEGRLYRIKKQLRQILGGEYNG